jgi:U6 snRNA-associated Sm-like protein LSm8
LGLLVFKFGIICDILVDIDKMVSTLDVMVERLVSVITTDGRHYVGILKGFDQALNIILSQAKLFSWEPLLTEIDCKAQIIRGDTVVLIGLLESPGLLPDSAEPLKRSL